MISKGSPSEPKPSPTTRCVTTSGWFERRWYVTTSPISIVAGSTSLLTTRVPGGMLGCMLPVSTVNGVAWIASGITIMTSARRATMTSANDESAAPICRAARRVHD